MFCPLYGVDYRHKKSANMVMRADYHEPFAQLVISGVVTVVFD